MRGYRTVVFHTMALYEKRSQIRGATELEEGIFEHTVEELQALGLVKIRDLDAQRRSWERVCSLCDKGHELLRILLELKAKQLQVIHVEF